MAALWCNGYQQNSRNLLGWNWGITRELHTLRLVWNDARHGSKKTTRSGVPWMQQDPWT